MIKKKQSFRVYVEKIEFYLSRKLTRKEKDQLRKKEIYFDKFTGDLEKNFTVL